MVVRTKSTKAVHRFSPLTACSDLCDFCAGHDGVRAFLARVSQRGGEPEEGVSLMPLLPSPADYSLCVRIFRVAAAAQSCLALLPTACIPDLLSSPPLPKVAQPSCLQPVSQIFSRRSCCLKLPGPAAYSLNVRILLLVAAAA